MKDRRHEALRQRRVGKRLCRFRQRAIAHVVDHADHGPIPAAARERENLSDPGAAGPQTLRQGAIDYRDGRRVSVVGSAERPAFQKGNVQRSEVARGDDVPRDPHRSPWNLDRDAQVEHAQRSMPPERGRGDHPAAPDLVDQTPIERRLLRRRIADGWIRASTTSCATKPRGIDATPWALRSRSPAATTRTPATATCAVTSACWRRPRPVAPGPGASASVGGRTAVISSNPRQTANQAAPATASIQTTTPASRETAGPSGASCGSVSYRTLVIRCRINTCMQTAILDSLVHYHFPDGNPTDHPSHSRILE